MRANNFCLALLLGILVNLPAFAQMNLYDNGPTNGTTDAWTINFGFAVSNSFPVHGSASIYAIAFAAWLFSGDVLESAEVSITSEEFGGTTYFDQTVTFTQSGCVGNQYGYNVCTETGDLPWLYLDDGTYWLNLQNASVNTGDPVYWDENSGPSSASANEIGTIPSESFTLFGGGCAENRPDCGPPPPTTPEPGSLLLLISGGLASWAWAGRLRRLL
jgi:hypothetical protein